MEKTGITITKRKDGRNVGKFIAEYADNGKAQHHYVYGKTYEEAENKVLIPCLNYVIVRGILWHTIRYT